MSGAVRRIVLCGGGTGGHVYPLLAVRAAITGAEWLYIGGDGIERQLAAREGVPYQAISGGGLHGVGLARALPNLARLLRGVFQARRLLARFRPQAVLATGGFITVPVAVTARLARIPVIVYLPDIEPALSVRVLGRLATRITATAETSQRFFDARKFVATGYPIRRELLEASRSTRTEARRQFGIGADANVLLVFGGSRGARSINRAIMAATERLLASMEIIHVSGEGEWAEVQAARQSLPEPVRERYHAFPYLHAEMGAALGSADLAVTRAGASTLGELALFGLPAVLVPYPHAWRYQKVNAEYLIGYGAAEVVRDQDLPTALAPLVERLLNDRDALGAMSARARALAKPQAAAAIAQVVLDSIA